MESHSKLFIWIMGINEHHNKTYFTTENVSDPLHNFLHKISFFHSWNSFPYLCPIHVSKVAGEISGSYYFVLGGGRLPVSKNSPPPPQKKKLPPSWKNPPPLWPVKKNLPPWDHTKNFVPRPSHKQAPPDIFQATMTLLCDLRTLASAIHVAKFHWNVATCIALISISVI